MTQSELDRWNNRFASADFVFGEAPNHFLQRHATGLPPGAALCVADGEGRNGVWLAEQGWQVLSLDFSAVAQRKAAELAARRGVSLQIEQGDVHGWPYPEAQFDLVADIFSQFSAPDDRRRKWDGMLRALKPGGWVILQGYTPAQLQHGTGGPKQVENLYTPALLHSAFAGLQITVLEEAALVLDEGPGHRGPSAVIGMVARKPPPGGAA